MPEPLVENITRLDYVKVKPAVKGAVSSGVVWVLRGCPHCGGDMVSDTEVVVDKLEETITCINCGYRR